MKKYIVDDISFPVLAFDDPVAFRNITNPTVRSNRFRVLTLGRLYDQRPKRPECTHEVPHGIESQCLYERTFFIRNAMRIC
jgi:hypothetical protein